MRRAVAAIALACAATTGASCILIDHFDDPVPDPTASGGAPSSSSSASGGATGGQSTGGNGGMGTTSSSSSASSTSTASSSGATTCTPNAMQSCYTGPPSTINTGVCHGGMQTCAGDGSAWGPCMGEVVPTPEDCTTALDEDCDGQTPPCQGGTTLWAKRYGGTLDDSGANVAVDGAGNVYLAGRFQGMADFGMGPVASAGLTDAFLVKLDPAGHPLLSKRWGDAADQAASVVAVDGMGSIWVGGNFTGTLAFGGATQPLVSAGGGDVFLAKLDATGAPVWARAFGDASPQTLPIGRTLAVDAAGDAVLAGAFQGSIDLGGGPITSAGLDDVFVAKLDTTGKLVWGYGYGDAYEQQARAVAIGPGGHIAVAGSMAGSMDFGGGHVVTSGGGRDVFVAVLDGTGACVWAKAFGDGADQDARAVAFDAAGNVWVTGSFLGAIDFGAGPLAGQGTGTNVFVAALDPTGAHVASQRYGDGTGGGQSARALAIDATGNVVVAGEFGGVLDFGGGPLTGAGANDAFVAKLTPVLAPLWSHRYGDPSAQSLNGVTTDASLNVIVTGPFVGPMDFGVTTLTSAGGNDAWVAKLAP